MEKLPTIILPPGMEGEATSPRGGGPSLGAWEQLKVPSTKSPLRLGGIRLRCPRPQQLVDDFYVKRLGMQELTLVSSPAARPGVATDSLQFRPVLPQRPQPHQTLQQSSSIRWPQKRSSPSSSRLDLGSALGDGSKIGLKEHEGQSVKAASRHASFSSQYSSRYNGLGVFHGANRFAAFEFFSTAELEAACTEEHGEANAPSAPIQKNWLKCGFGQFVLECLPVQKLHGLYKPYEYHRSDVFSKLGFTVCDVDATALYLSQHMIRMQPAGQFLDMGYAASFLDPHNFRGRLLQYMSEYKMVSRKALQHDDLKRLVSDHAELANKVPPREKPKRPDTEHSESPKAPSEGGGDTRGSTSPLSSSFSSTLSSAASVVQAERDGCLPAPSPDDLRVIEPEESATPGANMRFDTLPLDRLPVLHHVEFFAADAERTLSFYEEVLGMTLIEKKIAHGFGFTLYYLAFDPPTHTPYRYWLWLQRFSCICIKAITDGSKVSRYHDLEPAECGFLGITLLCSEGDEEGLLKRFHSKNVNVDYVEDEVYGRKVMLLRDPQNVPIRIAVTS